MSYTYILLMQVIFFVLHESVSWHLDDFIFFVITDFIKAESLL